MKTKKNVIILLFIAIITPVFASAQSINTFAATQKNDWEFIKTAGENVINGVSIYLKNAECNSEKVKIAKVVNTNSFSVKVSYQLSENQPVVNIMVPASVSIEGSCAVKDGNLAKLVFTLPQANSKEEKQKRDEFARTHLFVSKIE